MPLALLLTSYLNMTKYPKIFKFSSLFIQKNSADSANMPTIIIAGYKFRFYSSDRYEPPHVHVIKGEREAKIWLHPVEVEYNRRYNQPELNRIVKLTQQHQNQLLEAWNEYFTP